MRRLLSIAIIIALSGCVVSKETYQTQYLETRELAAKNEDLSSSLSAQTARNDDLSVQLETLTEEVAAARRDNEHGGAALAEVRQRLERCQTMREELGTELDVSKKTVRTADVEHDQLRALLDKERTGYEAELKRLLVKIDERDSHIEQLRTTISTLRAALDVINEQNELLEREKREKIDEMSTTYEELLDTMADEIRQGRVTISKLKGQLTVNLVDEILFPSGSAEVKEEGKDVLMRLGEALIGVEDKMIVIEGHTDDVPIIGGLANRFPTNWELSTARAVSVVRYLSATAGLDPTRLSAVGFGQYHPVSENDTEEGRAKNRRIEIKLIPIEPGSDVLADPEGDTPDEEMEGGMPDEEVDGDMPGEEAEGEAEVLEVETPDVAPAKLQEDEDAATKETSAPYGAAVGSSGQPSSVEESSSGQGGGQDGGQAPVDENPAADARHQSDGASGN
jgi:chemotaxis protein MotB